MPPETNSVLNRLLNVVSRSLPMYLADAPPAGGSEQARGVLKLIVADQRHFAERIADYILSESGEVHMGEYPMYFTGLNDLSFEYLIGRMIAVEERDLGRIETCVRELNGDSMARALAEEVLGATKGHLENLRDLTGAPAGTLT